MVRIFVLCISCIRRCSPLFNIGVSSLLNSQFTVSRKSEQENYKNERNPYRDDDGDEYHVGCVSFQFQDKFANTRAHSLAVAINTINGVCVFARKRLPDLCNMSDNV